MNKSDLIAKIARSADIPRATAEAALKATIDNISDALSNEETVELVGFGKFVVRKREARKGRNPKTGAEILIPGAKVPAFKAGKQLKDAVQDK